MSDTTFEERCRCPRCGQPGEPHLTDNKREGKTYAVFCRNERCKWFDTSWAVDVNPDGSMPVVKPHKKAYRPIPGDITERVQAAADAEISRSLDKRR